MLIEFKVSNYKSFAVESQTLSLVANKDSNLWERNCFESKTGTVGLPLVRAAVLYGANASGKSNLIAALACMRRIVARSATNIQEGQALNITPFLLDKKISNKPTTFEIIFIEDNTRYQYGFSATDTRIVEEWLVAFPKPKGQNWFLRKYDTKTDQYEWHYSSHLKGTRHIWERATRSNALFLSTAVNLNSEQLRPVFNWFVNKLFLLESNKGLSIDFTIDALKKNKRKEILQFLQAADLGITNIEVKERKAYRIVMQNDDTGQSSIKNVEVTLPEVKFYHHCKNSSEPISFAFSEESEGTQRLFAYAGYVLKLLEQNHVLVADELSSSLHPTLMRFLLKLIHDPKLNKANSQLFFTTHDTTLLDTTLFRRDQVWFMEKNQEQASQLYPLTDFSPRKDEALEKGYLRGRYGAIPFIGELEL